MVENILIYTIVLLTLYLLSSAIYLEVFLVRKLHREICIGKKQQKIPLWQGVSKRLACLKSFESVDPYACRVKRALLHHRIDVGVTVVLVAAVLVYKVLGYGSADDGDPHTTIQEHLTVTVIDNNGTTVKHYDDLDSFLKK